jgi:beta-phosphoglucomutase-like phosphatase (HAD superfamily)
MLDHDAGVIFDLDGVLVDTGWAHKQSWYDLAEKERFGLSDDLSDLRADDFIKLLTKQSTS